MAQASFVRFGLFAFALLLTTVIPASGQETYNSHHDLVLPEFVTDSPRYCLLTFPAGGGNRQTVLIVVDGDRLYVDKNSDGELTNSDECLVSTREDWQSDRDHHFTIDEIRVGDRIHKTLQIHVQPLENYDRGDQQIRKVLEVEPAADCYTLQVEIQDDRFQGEFSDGRVIVFAGFQDIDGVLQFGKDLKTAPTVNFSGDLEIRLFGETKLRPGAEAEIMTSVGTRGAGPGTFASIGYEGVIPESACPRVSLQVNADEIGKLETTTHELSHRC
jgi:hypothetical protein